MSHISFKPGNFIAVYERERKIVEVIARSENEACEKAQNFFEKATGMIEHIVVIQIPLNIKNLT